MKNEDRNEHDSASEEACRESLRKLDELWEDLASSLGFVIPLLKEVSRVVEASFSFHRFCLPVCLFACLIFACFGLF